MSPVYREWSSSVAKMKAMMTKSIQSSTRHAVQELNELLDFAAKVELLSIEWQSDHQHFKTVVGDIQKQPNDESVKRAVSLALRHDTSGLLVFDLWREFGEALRNLICCNYQSVPRSLRWMLEATVFWTDWQLEKSSAHERFESYYRQREKMDEAQFQTTIHEIFVTSYATFEERLSFMEKYRRPGFNEILNGLSLPEQPSHSVGELPRIKQNLRQLYSEFSRYSHISLKSVREIFSDKIRGDFALYQNYAFDSTRHDQLLRSLWKTIDNLLSLIIIVEARFTGYSTPKEFVESTERDRSAPVLSKKIPLLDQRIAHKHLPVLTRVTSQDTNNN